MLKNGVSECCVETAVWKWEFVNVANFKSYIRYQRERQNYLVTNFPEIWKEFQAREARALLAAAISPL